MPLVHVKMHEGRSLDQKRAMVKKITEAVCETAICKPESVIITIEEMRKEDHATAGVLVCDK